LCSYRRHDITIYFVWRGSWPGCPGHFGLIQLPVLPQVLPRLLVRHHQTALVLP
jgi:hypothetical protein